ncbi:MAG: bifunctional 5,10-methylenetetrahydrofolate dehydrogenase/5,10-methenyltetrahydrofolate cyclohydrolase, partial [Firmicutes bacterium]|nr:bifunctional 5,10-methylenetetrahydrofolate dehydrogenase/5,10-methenyltetrahydrofolate cyclohydrolase [Bacillota bacterium]
GILVQLPLPKQVDASAVIAAIDPNKDVDGLTWVNAGRLVASERGLRPCTPAGIMTLLDEYAVPLDGKHAVVIGRSRLVGKPLALLLLERNATVTICHSHTQNVAQICAQADVLVAAVGQPRLVTEDFVKPGAAVIDVGINRIADHLVGDVDFEAAARRAGWITPVPGGVGPMTIAQLIANAWQAFLAQEGARND